MLTFNKIVHLAAVNAVDIGVKYRPLPVIWRSESSLRKQLCYKVFVLDSRCSGKLMNPRALLVHKSPLTGPYADTVESCLPLRIISLSSLIVFVILPSQPSSIEWPLLCRFVKQMSFFLISPERATCFVHFIHIFLITLHCGRRRYRGDKPGFLPPIDFWKKCKLRKERAV
jgi:hypothetical protein